MFCPAMGTNLGAEALDILKDMTAEFFAPLKICEFDAAEQESRLADAFLFIHNLNEDELSLLTEKHPDLELICAGNELAS